MNSDFWIKKWENGETRFHQTNFHPQLVKHVGFFSPGTILVPLCGKTLDMVFLARKGFTVIGVELSPIACRDFFTENNIPFREKAVKNFLIFESDQITLWCGDFFQLPRDVWAKVTGVYDRAALIALPQDLRIKYANEFWFNNLKILLLTLEYPDQFIQGPPFSVTESEVKTLYPAFSIEKAESVLVEEFKDHPKFGTTSVRESVYRLS